MPASSKPKKSDDRGPGSDEDFVYTTDAGDTITVPSMAVAPRPSQVQLLRAGAQRNDALAALLLLEAAAGDAIDDIDALPSAEQNAFMEAWRAHSGVGLGESRRS